MTPLPLGVYAIVKKTLAGGGLKETIGLHVILKAILSKAQKSWGQLSNYVFIKGYV